MDEIDEQLKQLDQINLIINGMKNGSEESRAKFTAKADQMIKDQSKVVIDKTRINSTNQNEAPVTANLNPTFAAMERDAQERYERKKKNRVEAMKIKDGANDLFKSGDFEQAEKGWGSIWYGNRAEI